jgi:hypothetical protein
MFPIAAIPFDEYDALDIADGPRWLLVRLARYADRDGLCFPSIRTLAAAARKSPATICRWLKKLFEEGCFTRTREAAGSTATRWPIGSGYAGGMPRNRPRPRVFHRPRGVFHQP